MMLSTIWHYRHAKFTSIYRYEKLCTNIFSYFLRHFMSLERLRLQRHSYHSFFSSWIIVIFCLGDQVAWLTSDIAYYYLHVK